jgi:hypothetical protein
MLGWIETGAQPPESQLAAVELVARQSSLGFGQG